MCQHMNSMYIGSLVCGPALHLLSNVYVCVELAARAHALLRPRACYALVIYMFSIKEVTVPLLMYTKPLRTLYHTP